MDTTCSSTVSCLKIVAADGSTAVSVSVDFADYSAVTACSRVLERPVFFHLDKKLDFMKG
jgi:hypothetical protein